MRRDSPFVAGFAAKISVERGRRTGEENDGVRRREGETGEHLVDATERLAGLVERNRKGVFQDANVDSAEFLRFNGVRVGVFENFRVERRLVDRLGETEINDFGRRRETLLERFAGLRVFQRFERKRLAGQR